MVQQTHFKKLPLKNCFVCRYHGGDGETNAEFCKVRKKSVGSNEAVACGIYRSFASWEACEEANKLNDAFKGKRTFDSFVRRMTGGSLI